MDDMLISSLSNEEALGAGAVFGMLAGLGVMAVIISLVVAVLMIIAMWRIFTKAGEKGWKSIIPIYNFYILFKIAGRSFVKYFLIVLGSQIVSSISAAIASNGGPGFITGILGIVAFALMIWGIVEAILMLHGLSKNFGHGAGFTVGLVFLSTIFMLILGLGSSQYIGTKSE